MPLADELNALIAKKGLNKNRVAVALGVNRSSVGYWLNGRTIPADEHLEPLADLLGVPASRLRRLASEERQPLHEKVANLEARIEVVEKWVASHA